MQQPDEDFWKGCEGVEISGQYYLEQLLGCGGFGGVFRAARIVAGKHQAKRVAVKLMLSGVIQAKELEFAINLPSYQNLVQHFGGNNLKIGNFPMFYLVMELGDRTLADLLKQRGQIPSLELKPIVRDIAQGLQYLHEVDSENSQDKKYVHRDLKLANVLQFGGAWKIADFGMAKALDRDTMLASRTAGGTPPYMPPEYFRDHYVSTKWDVWSLGVMIVQILTGHLPFYSMLQNTEAADRELQRKIQRDSPDLRGVPDEWLDIVKGCLTKEHTRRWTAAKVLLELEKIEASATQKPLPPPPDPNPDEATTVVPPLPPPDPPISKKIYLLIAVIIGLISGGGYLWSKNALPFMQTPVVFSETSKESASKFFESGVKKEKEKNYLGAIADYQEAVKLNPDFDEAYRNLGDLQYGLGDKKSAIINFKELAKIYQKKGKSKEDIEKILVGIKMVEMEVQKQ